MKRHPPDGLSSIRKLIGNPQKCACGRFTVHQALALSHRCLSEELRALDVKRAEGNIARGEE